MAGISTLIFFTLISSFILAGTNCQDAAGTASAAGGGQGITSSSATVSAGDANKGVLGNGGNQFQPGLAGFNSPDVITRVNNGVSTILGGVWRASLQDILRGSFMFTRNENVRSVANNVIDSVFKPYNDIVRGGGGSANANANALNRQGRSV